MPDEPSLGELGRLIQALRADVRDDLAQLNTRLDQVVPLNVYTIEKGLLVDRVTALETARVKDAEKVSGLRRWLIGAVIVPLIGVLIPVLILLVQGAGS
ncbi:hypothetical protein [Streptomyces sp. H39-C1]|uniref:hypothetical protein n=1 Tax=Streptomyces sp. H39-C1 TaxID=3004355 RepID=UPI0022AFC47D|nr:hypothetical protein [Streptomyces sp. H39-C1]MCZ4099835.1 hypothetical protein [Streptomyces sp. H39-C1]